ncbi:MAG: cell division protein FtsQ/DivIB [Pseudohongiellaceae bacterium]
MTAVKRDRKANVSFSAYSGAGDIPEDFASMSAVGAEREAPASHGGRAPAGRGRLLMLLAVLGVTLSLAWQQYGDSAAGLLAEHVSLPAVQWPDRLLPEGPWLDRPFRSARIDTPLSRLREDEIRAVLAGHLDHGFFSLDVEMLKQELQRHPWISRASVRRVWPDGLSVSVYEHRPIARWGDEGLINLQGEIFGVGDLRDTASLPRLDGPSDSPGEVMRQYQQFSQMLQPAGLRISELTLAPRGGWHLALETGTEINVGRDALAERLQRFLALYQQEWQHDDRPLQSVDLRYNSGLAVRFGEPAGESVAALSQGSASE